MNKTSAILANKVKTMNKTASILCRKQLKKAQASDKPPLEMPSPEATKPSGPSSRPQMPVYRAPQTVGDTVGAAVSAAPDVVRGLYDASRRAAARIPGTEGFRQLPLSDRLSIVNRQSKPDMSHAGERRTSEFFNKHVPQELKEEVERRHLGRTYPSTTTSMIQDLYGPEERVPERLWRDYSSAMRADRGGLTPEALRDAMGLPEHDLPLATGPVAGHMTSRNIGTVSDVAAAAMRRNPLGLLSALLRQSQSYGPESYGMGALDAEAVGDPVTPVTAAKDPIIKDRMTTRALRSKE